MVDYSIEYVHTYIDEIWSEEHILILDHTKKIIERIKSEGKTYSLNVLIDNYNPKLNRLNIDEFIFNLEKYGLSPNNVILEKDLTVLEEELFNKMEPGRLHKSYKKYIEEKNHLPCSFLVAIWYAVRLGVIEIDGLNFYLRDQSENLIGKKLINILQNRFKDPESKAYKIIQNSSFSDRIYDIEDIFV